MAFKMVGPRLGANADLCRQIALGGFALAVVFGGVWLYPRALRSLRHFRLDIDVLMGLAILGLWPWDSGTKPRPWHSSSAWPSRSNHSAWSELLRDSPAAEIGAETAERIGPDGAIERIPAGQVRFGDRILIRAGDTVPIDGVVVSWPFRC